MAGTQFGGSGNSGDDRFGYYSAVVTKPTGPAGGPGSPTGAFGAPYQQTQAEPTRSSALWVGLLVVIVVLIGAVVGGWWWKQHDRLIVPEQLGGMQINTTSQASKGMDAALAQASDRAGGRNRVVGAVYGAGTDETILIISRGPDVSAAQPPATGTAGVKAYGPDLCQATGKLVTCVRARANLAVVVMAYRKGVPVPAAVVAGWADEAWAAQ